jgi:O-antigen ligase
VWRSATDEKQSHPFILFAQPSKNLARNVTAKTTLTPETLKTAHSSPVRATVICEPAPHIASAPSQPGPIATAGFVLFCVYLLSGFANDWALHLFGSKAYLSTVTLLLLPLAWLFSGKASRGFHSRTGRCWIAFLLWLLLAAPFSIWRGGSAALIVNYVPRAYFCFFYTCSFVTSLRRCRQLMYVQIASGAALLVSCAIFGDSSETRLRIPSSLFFGNSNDLALALLLAISSFLFLLTRPTIGPRLAGGAGILLAAFYAFQTGSRGSVIAASSMFGLIFWLSRHKWKVLALALAVFVALFGAAIAGAPSSTLHRLSLLLDDPATSLFETSADLASLASQQQRHDVFYISLRYTLMHPLFGVGPDQFPNAVQQDAARSGRHTQWLGTHNSYTQISSECGIPALIFYAAVIVFCLRSNLRLYLATRDRPEHHELAALSRCLLAGTCVYAVSAFFFHMAYSADLPMLSGFSVALQAHGRNIGP